MPINRPCPNYLRNYQDLWEKDPHAANLAWWKQAKFGLFIHYGLYSTIGGHEWAQYRQNIPVAQYAKLANSFTAHNFDPDFITDLALDCGMQYINMVTCHHDSFCLWDSKTEPFNSANTPCNRDLVREMAEMCDKKGLGFVTYYTFIQNWKHPYAPSCDVFATARPHYDTPQPEYLYQKPEDFQIFLAYMKDCIKELLADVGTTACIWFDIILGAYPYAQQLGFDVNEIYDMVREMRPDILIAWKQGATGTEDFAAPEQHFHSLEGALRERFGEEAALQHRAAWEKNAKKHNEICATLQERSWAFDPYAAHRDAQYCYDLLGHAHRNNCNLCLNVGPVGDGSISPIQVDILRQLAKKIRKEGWPTDGEINTNTKAYGAE